MNKKILITGGSGFIARSLHEEFSNCYFLPLKRNVLTPSRKELDLLNAQKVFDYIKENKFDIIIHSATYDAVPRFSTKDSALVLENNLKMFFNIARASDYFGKMIYFGSGAEAGREKWIPRMTEEYIESQMPKDQYGLSKHIMNEYAQLSNNIYNLRLFGVFGKFDDWRYRFVSNACCKTVLDMPITINQNVRFDYMDINDLVKIVKWFIDNDPKHHSYNVCSGKAYDYVTLANKILSLSLKDLRIIVNTPGLKKEYSGDNTLLKDTIKDFEFTDLDESIKELYNWFCVNKQIIQKELFEY